VAGFELLTLRWWGSWGDCSTIVLLMLTYFYHSHSVSAEWWTQTLDLRIVRRWFYHCASAVVFFLPFSQSMIQGLWLDSNSWP
jgi:hypothetical protein